METSFLLTLLLIMSCNGEIAAKTASKQRKKIDQASSASSTLPLERRMSENILWEDLSLEEVQEQQFVVQALEQEKNFQNVAQAKMFLISGNLDKAKRLLELKKEDNLLIKLLKLRYLGTIAFMRNDFALALEYFSYPELLSKNSAFQKICHMKIIANLMQEQNLSALATSEFRRCHQLNLQDSPTQYLWAETLFRLKKRDTKLYEAEALQKLLPKNNELDVENLRIWLKLAIYLNREKEALALLPSLSPEFFRSQKIRELIGFLYYRVGDDKNALNFIEDIPGPNAENIRGNIKLKEEKFELAYGHFQLALKKKQNSVNAIERSLPLVWVLQQWQEGIHMLTRTHTAAENRPHKLSLLSAFQLEDGRIKDSWENLLTVNHLFQGRPPQNVLVMLSFNAALLEKLPETKKYSELACQGGDGLNCWFLLQAGSWENVNLTLQREGTIVDKVEEQYSQWQNHPLLTPLTEDVFVNQSDIEELDDAEFRLQF